MSAAAPRPTVDLGDRARAHAMGPRSRSTARTHAASPRRTTRSATSRRLLDPPSAGRLVRMGRLARLVVVFIFIIGRVGVLTRSDDAQTDTSVEPPLQLAPSRETTILIGMTQWLPFSVTIAIGLVACGASDDDKGPIGSAQVELHRGRGKRSGEPARRDTPEIACAVGRSRKLIVLSASMRESRPVAGAQGSRHAPAGACRSVIERLDRRCRARACGRTARPARGDQAARAVAEAPVRISAFIVAPGSSRPWPPR